MSSLATGIWYPDDQPNRIIEEPGRFELYYNTARIPTTYVVLNLDGGVAGTSFSAVSVNVDGGATVLTQDPTLPIINGGTA